MKLLLDTNILIALAGDFNKLGKKTQELLTNTDNILTMSYFSLMEVYIKNRLGKLPIHDNFIDELQNTGIELLLPSISELQNYHIVDSENKDPFDNFILAHCASTKQSLITFDKKLLHQKKIKTYDGRM